MAESADAAFVEAVIDAAQAAERQSTPTVQRLDVAGVLIDVHYASPALHGLFAPALAHLERPTSGSTATSADGSEAYVVRVWDTAGTGIPAPPPPVSREKFTDRGDVLGLNDPAYRVAFHWSDYSVCVFDVAAREAAYWVSEPSHLPYWARSSPFRTILGWVLELHGVQLLHAAAVATDDGAVLIVGSGGAGKSTTALTCLEAGLRFLGDDYVAVSLNPPTVHSLYATAKIADPGHPAARRFATIPSCADDEKLVLQLLPEAGSQLARSAPLRAVVTPQIVDSESTDVAPVDRDRIEHAATFTTLAQLPHAGALARQRIGRVLDSVPIALLRLGRDPAGVVASIRRLAAQPHLAAAGSTAAAAASPASGPASPASGPASAASGAASQTSTSPSFDPADASLPTVTVVIPVHNGAHFLATAIDSIVQQRYPHLEIVVVDDGSDDDLESALAALPVDVRVHHQATAGPASARNTGIALASSELVAFLDVDDRWPAESLRTLVREWMIGGAAVVIGRAQVVELDAETADEHPIGTPDTAFSYYIGSALFERAVFDRVGVFDPQMLYGEDTDWFARLVESGEPLRRLSAVTLIVRRHGQNMTQGRDLVGLHVVRAVKKALDRQRARNGDADT